MKLKNSNKKSDYVNKKSGFSNLMNGLFACLRIYTIMFNFSRGEKL